MSERALATVAGSVFEAQLIVGMLESNGITAALSADDAGGMDPALDVTNGVRVFVDEADLDIARALIASPPS